MRSFSAACSGASRRWKVSPFSPFPCKKSTLKSEKDMISGDGHPVPRVARGRGVLNAVAPEAALNTIRTAAARPVRGACPLRIERRKGGPCSRVFALLSYFMFSVINILRLGSGRFATTASPSIKFPCHRPLLSTLLRLPARIIISVIRQFTSQSPRHILFWRVEVTAARPHLGPRFVAWRYADTKRYSKQHSLLLDGGGRATLPCRRCTLRAPLC